MKTFLALSLLAFAGFMPTCGDARPVETPPAVKVPALPGLPPTPAKAGETPTETLLRLARDDLRAAEEAEAQATARVYALTEARDTERREAFLGTLRASCLWVAGLALLGALACAVLAWLSPIAKPTLVKAAAGCGALLVLAVGCAWCVPWLPVVGVVSLVALVLGLIAYGVWRLVLWWPSFANAAVAAADGYQQAVRIARAVAPGVAYELDVDNRALQLTSGAKVFDAGDQLHSAARAARARRQTIDLPAEALP